MSSQISLHSIRNKYYYYIIFIYGPFCSTSPSVRLLCCLLHWVWGFDFLIFCFLLRVMFIILIIFTISCFINTALAHASSYDQTKNRRTVRGKSGRSHHQPLQRLESTVEGPKIQDGFWLTSFYSSTVLSHRTPRLMVPRSPLCFLSTLHLILRSHDVTADQNKKIIIMKNNNLLLCLG